jgi:hypothetical protein
MKPSSGSSDLRRRCKWKGHVRMAGEMFEARKRFRGWESARNDLCELKVKSGRQGGTLKR